MRQIFSSTMWEILPQLLVNAVITGSIYALASCGLSLVYSLLRILNLAHGHFMMVGAYAFCLAFVDWEAGLFQSLVFTAGIAALLSWFTLRVFVNPFRRYSGFLVLVTTLALSTILESAVSIYFGVNVRSLSAGWTFQTYEISGVFITSLQIGVIAGALGIFAVLGTIVHSTAFGRRMRAIAESDSTAQTLGISVASVTRLVFFCGTVLAAVAGILVGYETNLQPTMGNLYTMKALAAMVLGGLGNLWGTVVGSFLIGLVENLSVGIEINGFSIPAGYKDAFAFIIILFMLLFRPQGLFGTAMRRA